MPKDFTFEEMGRLTKSNTQDIIVSKAFTSSGDLKGYSINTYITSDRYTGWGKGVMIPEDLLLEFLAIFEKLDLELALDQKG